MVASSALTVDSCSLIGASNSLTGDSYSLIDASGSLTGDSCSLIVATCPLAVATSALTPRSRTGVARGGGPSMRSGPRGAAEAAARHRLL